MRWTVASGFADPVGTAAPLAGPAAVDAVIGSVAVLSGVGVPA